MKILLLTILSLTVLSSTLTAEELRTWFLEDGRTFKASFIDLKKDKVALKNDSGKTAVFPVASLSIVDRYYLNSEKEIPIEQLGGGNYKYAERKMKFRSSDVKKLPAFQFKAEDCDVKLNAEETPHFLFLSDRGAQTKDFYDGAERLWYSLAYRVPGFIDWWGEKKKTMFFLKSRDIYNELGAAHLAEIKESVESLVYNQVKLDWKANPGQHRFHIPQEYAEKYNCESKARIHVLATDRERRKTFKYHFTKQLWRTNYFPGVGISQKGKPLNNPQWYYSLAQNYTTVIQIHEGDFAGFGSGLETGNGFPIGEYGEPKKWGPDLEKAVEKDKIKATFACLQNHPANEKELISAEAYRNFGMLMVACGRFMQKDLKHMIHYCAYSEFLQENKKYPNHEEIAEIFGYESTDALDAALKEFILEENTKFE